MSWQPLNLALIEDRPPVMPTLGALGLLYPGRRHIFSGMPESGKTIAAYIEIIAVARAGGRAILIDLEMGQWDARDRLRDLGATDADLERILYIEPTTSATPEIIAGLVALEPMLVVIDAAAGAYELSALDDNKRQDVEVFARLYVNAFWTAGIATVVIDHVGKAAEQGSRYAIGSERKVGGADVHLGFVATKAPHRGGTGLLKITTHKDRFGHLPRPTAGTLRLDSDPETHAISWTLEPAAAADGHSPSAFRPTVLMERVSRYLETQPEPVSRNAVETNVNGNREYVRLAMDVLTKEQYLREQSGPRNARELASLKPYREADDATSPTSPDLAPTSPPAKSKMTSPTSPTPYKGGEVRGEVNDAELERLEHLESDLFGAKSTTGQEP